MGRKLGGIEESELRELILVVVQESLSQHREDIKRLMQGAESLELQLQQDREDAARRMDDEAQTQDERVQKAMDQLDVLDTKVDRRLEAVEQKIETLLDQKVSFEDVEVKISSLAEKVDKVCDHGEVGDRLEDLERVLRQKAGASHVDSELGTLRKGLQMKVDVQDMEDKLAAAKQHIWKKAESNIGTIQQQLQKKADMLNMNDRMDRLEQQVALIPGNPCETPNELSKRLESIERTLQQKADNEAIDASLDELDQRMERKADCSLVDERLRNLERQLQHMAEIVDFSDRIADIEESIGQKADLADFASLRLALDRLGQNVEERAPRAMLAPAGKEATRSQSASARLRTGSGQHESDGSMPPLVPQSQARASSSLGRKVVRRTSATRGQASEVQPSPRKSETAWRPNLTGREDSRGPSPSRLQRSRSPGAETSPWATPRGSRASASRAASADAAERLTPTRLFGAAVDHRAPSPRKLRSPSREDGQRSGGAEARSHSPGPRMWRPRRQQ